MDFYFGVRAAHSNQAPPTPGVAVGGSDNSDPCPCEVWSVDQHPEGSGYFWYHHTDADMMTGVKREQIDLCVAAFAGFTWSLAEYGYSPPAAKPLP